MVALAATVVIHVSVASGVIWGGWLDAASGFIGQRPAELTLTIDLSPPVVPPEKPNTFVPVPEETAPPETDTHLYSNKSSSAASEPTEKPETGEPFIAGEEDLFPGTFNNPFPVASTAKASSPASPSNPAPQTAHTQAQPIAAAFSPPGGAAIAPSASPATAMTPAPIPLGHLSGSGELPPMPAPPPVALSPSEQGIAGGPTLAQASAAMAHNDFTQKALSDGGKLPKGGPGLNVKLTGFGAYDARFVEKVRLSWLRFRGRPGWLTPGVVVVAFRLHHDGRITHLRATDNSGHDLQAFYCSQAIELPSPFEPWTETMKRAIGANYRDCQFTFRYIIR